VHNATVRVYESVCFTTSLTHVSVGRQTLRKTQDTPEETQMKSKHFHTQPDSVLLPPAVLILLIFYFIHPETLLRWLNAM